ncbi:hypothetical protein AKO1_013306 [Acrasis kona]|uniref:PH domain-containing protein n=1 Tax=Acrasis kona TaxID=1008807 RepID=A0AAW2YZW2_9EUKA
MFSTELNNTAQNNYGGKVVYSGNLEYEGAKKKLFSKNYRSRFVIVTASQLVTFKDSSDIEKPIEDVNLTRYSSLIDIDNYKKMQHTFGLKVVGSDSSEPITMWFSAQSDTERKDFMDAIQAVIDEKKEGQRVLKSEVVDKIEKGETKQVVNWVNEGVYSKNAFLQISKAKGHQSHPSSRDLDVDNAHKVHSDLVLGLTDDEKLTLLTKGYRHGDTLFHIAVKNNDLKLVKSLLEKGANTNVLNTLGETPLHMLFRSGIGASLPRASPRGDRKLSASGSAPNIKEDILHVILEAKKRGMNESVTDVVKPTQEQLRKRKLLLIDTNAQEYDKGHTIVMLATLENDFELVNQCLYMDPTVDVNLCAHKGGTAMHMAVEGVHIRVLELLLKKGAGNCNIKDDKGLSVIDLAIRDYDVQGMLSIISSLFEFGQPEFEFDQMKKRIVESYIYVLTTYPDKVGRRANDLLTKILEYDASFALTSFEQNPINGIIPVHYPLTQAIKSSNIEQVQTLLRLGDASIVNNCEISVQGKETPLQCAINCKQGDIAALLIENGADVNTSAPDGSSPLQNAMRNSLMSTVKALLALNNSQQQLPEDAIYLAAGMTGSTSDQMIQQLVEHGADVNWTNQGRETALSSACYSGNIIAAKCLIDQYNLEVKGSGKESYQEKSFPPIHAAVMSDSTEMLQFLLDRGVDVNQCRVDLQMRPIHVASLYGKINAAKFLIEHGADLHTVINTLDDKNISAIHLAAGYGHKQVLTELLQSGHVNVDTRTENGLTALDFCLKRCSFGVVKTLVDHGAASDQMTIQLAISTGGLDDEMISYIEGNSKK